MKTQLSILALAVASTTAVYAAPKDDMIGIAEDDIKVIVNSDSQNIGGFIVQNGTPAQGEVINTFESHKDKTVIKAKGGNEFKLDGTGAHLSNITLDGVKDGEVADGSTEAINGSQLSAEKKAREEADDVLLDLLAGEEKARIENDDILLDLLAGEEKARIKGDRETLAAANAYTDQKINKLEKHYKAAVASSIAIASLPQPTTAGKNMFSIGAGTWESEQGYALGVSGVTMDNKWVYKVAASGDSRGNFGGGASVGFQW